MVLTAGGMTAAVALVLILLAAVGVFTGDDSSAAPEYAFTPSEVALIASAGQTFGSPDAPVTVIEFGDFR